MYGGVVEISGVYLMMLIHEIEITDAKGETTYIYIEAEDDIDIDIGDSENVTHLTTVNTDMGIEPDLIIKKIE